MAAIPTRGLRIAISRNDSGPPPSAVPVTVSAVSAANPAVLTASASDLEKMYDGMEITITAATLAKLNGIWPITRLTTTTFSIPVDTSADDTSTVTLTATIPGQASNRVPFSSISNALTPVVTVPADSIDRIKDGDVVAFDVTGISALDNGSFIVADLNTTANTFRLAGGPDLSGQSGPITSGTMLVYDMATTAGSNAAMLEFCLNAFSYATEPGTTIDVSTTCGKASLAGESGTGSITFAGYMDGQSLGFLEFVKAEADGVPRIIELIFPQDLGWILFPEVTINSFSFDIALDNAVTISGGGVVNQKPVYIFN